ncbi:MAG: capsular biosynthesis protein [Bacteroidaceae bacterium]|nr:capsular biosynthesis protein [Bacteroidaceae bacterium]
MFRLFKPKTERFDRLGITTDWHCHLLPGVDDGVSHIEHSARILESMRSAGITTVVHTPHFNTEIFPDNTEAGISDAFARYRDALPPAVLNGMNLRLAGEYMVTNGFEQRNMQELLQIEPGKVLVEMSYMYPSRTIEDTVFNIRMAGLTPVIAHPERYLYWADRLEHFDRLHEMGALFQLNLLSLQGCYGPASVHIMEYLLKNGLYSYVGTDTHTEQHFKHIAGLEFKASYLPLLKPLCR